MNAPTNIEMMHADRLAHVVEIVSAYVSHNSLSSADLPALIANTHNALLALSAGTVESTSKALASPVPIHKSVTPDFIICLEDGKKFKSLKRHLSGLGMTPDEYRAKWGLASNYPMVAPNYSATRSSLAKASGLGRRPDVASAISGKRTKKLKAST